MYAAKANGPRNGTHEPNQTAHAQRKRTRLTYIGLRETRYMPEVTNDEADCGFNGLTVVLLRRNAMKPAKSKIAPASASPTVRRIRTKLDSAMATVPRAAAHMARATTSATIGGGTLSSRCCSTVGLSLRLENLCTPGIVDRNEPTPIWLSSQNIGRLASHRDRLTRWIDAIQGPATDVKRDIVSLSDPLGLSSKRRLERSELFERSTQLGRTTRRPPRLRDQHRI